MIYIYRDIALFLMGIISGFSLGLYIIHFLKD